MCCSQFRFSCFLLSIKKKGLFIFSHKHLGLSLFLPLLFGSFFKERQFSPFPPHPQKNSLILGHVFVSFFLGGLSLVVLILVIMVPVVLLFFSFFNFLLSLSSLFFRFAFSSFLWFLVWVSTLLLTSVVFFCFFLFCGFLCFCFFVYSVLFLFFFFLLFFFFAYFSSFFFLWFFSILWFICDVAVLKVQFLAFPFVCSWFEFFCFNCCCICGVLVVFFFFCSCLLLFLGFFFLGFRSCFEVFLFFQFVLFPFTTWGGRSSGFHFWVFQNATFAIFARFVTFFGDGSCILQKTLEK